MAPTNLHQYHARSMSGGQKFTILFGVIAGSLIAGCFVWGFLIPLIRKKYFPPKPSQTKYNRYHPNSSDLPLISTLSSYRQHLNMSRRASTPVTLYDPRFQTPFPSAPTSTESIMLPSYNSPALLARSTYAELNLFTPTRGRRPVSEESRLANSRSPPRLRSRSEAVKSGAHDKDFGDAKEYILAVPEPLRLRSRTYGSQMLPSSTWGTLPESTKTCKSADKHIHPNKLFAELSKKDLRDSSCSSTSLKVEGSERSQEDNSSSIYNLDNDVSRSSKQSIDQHAQKQEVEKAPIEPMPDSPVLTAQNSELSGHNASVAAMHRLQTYRSLVGAPPPQPLSRAGTLTRPKTPVAKMRNMYDKGVGESKPTLRIVDRNDTMSTFLRDITDSSDHHSQHSSATSPQKASPQNFAASSLSLLPTPLRINRLAEQEPISTPVRRDSRFKEEFDDAETALPHLYNARQDFARENQPKLMKKDFSMPPIVGRPRPPPLSLALSADQEHHQRSPNFINSPITRIVKHIRRPEVTSFPASSIYSRDTQGMSIAQTPATPEFPGILSLRATVSPAHRSATGATLSSDKGGGGNLIKEEESPIDVANSKVENWDVDTSNIQLNTSPSSSLKRALSNLGPDCESTHDVSSGDEANRHSAISTEMAPSEARLSSVVGPVRISDCTFVVTPRKSERATVEGADWL